MDQIKRPEGPGGPAPMDLDALIVELRQYTLHRGARDALIDLFDREFVESQEAAGMRVIGQFRDLDDPDRFVWLRGFCDMPGRAQALKAFYEGPVWRQHRDAANATMIDSANVLLLRPARRDSGFSLEGRDRPPPGTPDAPRGLVVATLCYLEAPAGPDLVSDFERTLMPMLTDAGAAMLAYFVSENSANNYPALPVREDENVFVWFAGFADQAAYQDHLAALARSERWRADAAEGLAQRLKGRSEVRRLSPTSRSRLHG